MTSLLVITGTMGSGKSTVLAEASDLLAQRRIPHAAIDLDALGLAYLPSGEAADDFMFANLQSVCANSLAAGIGRLLIARALERRALLDKCRSVARAEHTVVCRLTADPGVLLSRVRSRDIGIAQPALLDRVPILNQILDRAALEDFTIFNQHRSVTSVALEALTRAAWISS